MQSKARDLNPFVAAVALGPRASRSPTAARAATAKRETAAVQPRHRPNQDGHAQQPRISPQLTLLHRLFRAHDLGKQRRELLTPRQHDSTAAMHMPNSAPTYAPEGISISRPRAQRGQGDRGGGRRQGHHPCRAHPNQRSQRKRLGFRLTLRARAHSRGPSLAPWSRPKFD